MTSKARGKGTALYRSGKHVDREKALFILESLLDQLRSALQVLRPKTDPLSHWSGYMDAHSYNPEAFTAKENFVRSFLAEVRPRRVLDIGANTGHFSALAAEIGAEVVAIDSDPGCAGAVWRRAQQDRSNILPLVVDLARPSPALGWRNGECLSFLNRATGNFDTVMMLAVVHHLLVSERIPLPEILRLACELTTSSLIIEFIAPQDEMFRQLTRGREHLHASMNEAAFENACARDFEIIRSLRLPGTCRTLYGLKRKGGAA
jgi:SAM-dependent methyltransferase